MRRTKLVAAAMSLLLWATAASAQEKYSKVKVYFPSIEAKRELVQLLQLDHFQVEGSALICEVGEGDLRTLHSNRFPYEVLVQDVASHLAEENKRFDQQQKTRRGAAARMAFEQPGKTAADMIKKPAAFHTNGLMGGYYNYSEMVAAMNQLVADYPNLVSIYSIGKSYLNKDIWGIKISDNVTTDEAEPEVLYTGLQHAREAITGTSLIFFMQYLTENYNSDARIKALLNSREIFIVPCVNVD